jgi:hypothetical protein
MSRILFFIFLSITFHFLSWKSGHYFGGFFSPRLDPTKKDKFIEISLLNQKPTNQIDQQMVRQPQIPKEIETQTEKTEKTQFYSEKNQRVKTQSKAALLGLTKNRFYETQKINRKKNIASGDSILKNFNEINSDNMGPSASNVKPDFFQNAPSTIGELLPDSIKVGEVTALNTDRHLFYTFYSRVEEAIRFRWENDVERTLTHINKNNYHNPKSIWSTRVDIILNSEGKFIKAILLKESGIKGLDFAAINSFREANYFPHPPREMVGTDGLIRLKYQFHVYFDPTRQTASSLNL